MKTLLIASERENDRTIDIPDDPNWTIRGKTDLEVRKDRENARKAFAGDMQIVATVRGTSYVIEEHGDGVHEYLRLIKEPIKDAPSYVIKDRVLSVSFGASTVTAPDESITDCIAASDAEMYRSKFEKMRKKQ
ncbi:MAG: hypothetical protein IJU52_00145 [Clostridia bacterium]|nr:hypothetical protein [Clostridia bacterium]